MPHVNPVPHEKYGMFLVEENFRHFAYMGNTQKMQEILNDHPNLNINAQNEYGQTAFYLACKSNQENTVDFLLAKNADIDIPTTLGNDALLMSTFNGNNPLVKKLIENGANINARTSRNRKDHAGVNAIGIAREQNNLALVEILENAALKNSKKTNPMFTSEPTEKNNTQIRPKS
ncbi:MAG: ankyrin repeat domain-containing protein [Gammaproteobacteria bacterium]